MFVSNIMWKIFHGTTSTQGLVPTLHINTCAITLLHTLAQSYELVLLTISVGQFDSSKSKLTECIFSLPDTPPTKEYPLKELYLYTDRLANR